MGCGWRRRSEGVGDWPVMEARSRHRGTIPAYLRGMRGARGVWRREAGHRGRLRKCPQKIIYECTLLIFIVILLPRLLLLLSFFTVMRKTWYKVRKVLVVIQKGWWSWFSLCYSGAGRVVAAGRALAGFISASDHRAS